MVWAALATLSVMYEDVYLSDKAVLTSRWRCLKSWKAKSSVHGHQYTHWPFVDFIGTRRANIIDARSLTHVNAFAKTSCHLQKVVSHILPFMVTAIASSLDSGGQQLQGVLISSFCEGHI